MSKKREIPETIDGKKVYYYYLTTDARYGLDDRRKLPIKYGVVAFVRHDAEDGSVTVSRGVSLCSWLDNFDKNYGKALAAARLGAALMMKSSSEARIYRGHTRNCPDIEGFLLRCYKDQPRYVEISMIEHDKRKEERENGKG